MFCVMFSSSVEDRIDEGTMLVEMTESPRTNDSRRKDNIVQLIPPRRADDIIDQCVHANCGYSSMRAHDTAHGNSRLMQRDCCKTEEKGFHVEDV